MIPLAIWTADNTAITADTRNFTADGANLINGGATDIREAPPNSKFSLPTYTVSAIIPF